MSNKEPEWLIKWEGWKVDPQDGGGSLDFWDEDDMGPRTVIHFMKEAYKRGMKRAQNNPAPSGLLAYNEPPRFYQSYRCSTCAFETEDENAFIAHIQNKECKVEP